MEMKKKILFNCLIIFLFTLIIRILPSTLGLLTADSCEYLDIARNISEGRGFNISYNIYQLWSGPFYPALIYRPAIFTVILSVVWVIFHSIYAATLLNVILSGINCILIYLILERMYRNVRVALWAAILISLAQPMFLTSINVWAEQLNLLFLLLAIFVFLKDINIRKSRLFLTGLILGFGFLTRIASAFNLLAFLIFIFFNHDINKKFSAMLYLLLGFFTILIPYELISLLKYGIAYPANLKVDIVAYLRASLDRGGYYVRGESFPLRANKENLDIILRNNLGVIATWIKLTTMAVLENLGILFYFLCARLLFPIFKTENKAIKTMGERLFIILILVNLFGHALSHYYQPFSGLLNMLNISRYSLLMYVLSIPVALAYFYNFLENHPLNRNQKLYYLGLFIIFFTFAKNIGPYFNRGLYAYHMQVRDIRQEVFSWVRQNSQSNDIIATSEIQEGFELSRPVISLPAGKLLTRVNMRDFLLIYKPSYILLSQDKLAQYKDMLAEFADNITPRENWSKSYQIYKSKL